MFDEWGGVVFDLDGTIVQLTVDWSAVSNRLRNELDAAEITAEGNSCWELLADATAAGERTRAEAIIAPAEIDGARSSERLPLADILADVPGPVGICSLNCQAACETALSVHGIARHVDVVVGRDTLDVWKPDPRPLRHTALELGIPPDRVLFIGDSRRDSMTAERADVAFNWVSEVQPQLD